MRVNACVNRVSRAGEIGYRATSCKLSCHPILLRVSESSLKWILLT
jgi:hypothetical protein